MDFNEEQEKGLDEVDGPNGKPTSPTSFPSYLKQVAKRSILGFERVHGELLRSYGDQDPQEKQKKKEKYEGRRMGSVGQHSFMSYIEPRTHDEASTYTANTKRELYSKAKLHKDNTRSLYIQSTLNSGRNFKASNEASKDIKEILSGVKTNTKDEERRPLKPRKPNLTSNNKSKVPSGKKNVKKVDDNTLYDILPSSVQDSLYDVPPSKAPVYNTQPTSEQYSLYDVPPAPKQGPSYGKKHFLEQESIYDLPPVTVRKVPLSKGKPRSKSEDSEHDYILMNKSTARTSTDSDERDYANVQEVITLKKPTKPASIPGDYVNCAAEYRGNKVKPNTSNQKTNDDHQKFPNTRHQNISKGDQKSLSGDQKLNISRDQKLNQGNQKSIGEDKKSNSVVKKSSNGDRQVESIQDPKTVGQTKLTFPDGASYAVINKEQNIEANAIAKTDNTSNGQGKEDDKDGDTLEYDYVDCEGVEEIPRRNRNTIHSVLNSGLTLRERMSQMDLTTTDADNSYVVMLKQRGTTKHPDLKFYSFSVEEVVDVLNACAMSRLANICLEENLDGEYFRQLQMEDFCDEPFNMSWFYIGKFYRIMNGWRPKRY